MKSVALLTKEMWIVTPQILGIVVCVAPRLILYRNKLLDHIVQRQVARSYRTWAMVIGLKEERNEAVRCICV